MYDIDFNTCTATDVIQRSYVCHPTLFAEHMREAARIHNAYAYSMGARAPRQIAHNMASALRDMATAIERQEFSPESLDLSKRVQALHIACKLQCVPYAVQRDLIERNQ
jgi:hypothetical protein